MTTQTRATTEEAAAQRPPPQKAAQPASPSRLLALAASVRTRILAWYVVLLALALVGSTLVIRQVLLVRLDEEIQRDLVQEVGELRVLVEQGTDPLTGRRFESVARIFEVFLSRSVPSDNETMITFVNGEPFRRSPKPPPLRLDTTPEFTRVWGNTDEPRLGSVHTRLGRVDYAAVPVQPIGGGEPGVFVVAGYRDLQTGEIREVTRVAAGVGFITLLLASAVAWVASGRVLAPVRLVTDAARKITETDLSRRIPADGNDEISQLARTFNAMLDRLEDAFITQRTFINDAGHELRTPITIIRGHLELLGDDPNERRETVAIVTDELERMSRLVDDLLVLVKAERPDFLDLQALEVEGLTRDVFAKARALGERDWRLAETGTGRIVADPQRLTQALVQLAQNATQHTAVGAPIVLGSSSANGHARFWVTDSGPGVAPEDRDHIFQRFARARGARRRSEGAGLGLAIVSAIATAHGGYVTLHSPPGSGATFELCVPFDPPVDQGVSV